MGISTGGKILCAQRGCAFHTKLGSDELFEHCRNEHEWGDFPCKEENCKFIAHSSTALKKHLRFHSIRASKSHEFRCSKRNCEAGFGLLRDLIYHHKVHDNVKLKCVFCPYTTVGYGSLTLHQRVHFNIREFKCDFCDKDFVKRGHLDSHFDEQHSGLTTKCPLCELVAPRRRVEGHLKIKHGINGSHWDSAKRTFILPN